MTDKMRFSLTAWLICLATLSPSCKFKTDKAAIKSEQNKECEISERNAMEQIASRSHKQGYEPHDDDLRVMVNFIGDVARCLDWEEDPRLLQDSKPNETKPELEAPLTKAASELFTKFEREKHSQMENFFEGQGAAKHLLKKKMLESNSTPRANFKPDVLVFRGFTHPEVSLPELIQFFTGAGRSPLESRDYAQIVRLLIRKGVNGKLAMRIAEYSTANDILRHIEKKGFANYIMDVQASTNLLVGQSARRGSGMWFSPLLYMAARYGMSHTTWYSGTPMVLVFKARSKPEKFVFRPDHKEEVLALSHLSAQEIDGVYFGSKSKDSEIIPWFYFDLTSSAASVQTRQIKLFSVKDPKRDDNLVLDRVLGVFDLSDPQLLPKVEALVRVAR